MAKQTMDAIRQAELDAEQTLRSAQVQANDSIRQAQADAEAMIADARRRASETLAETRAQAEQDSHASALAAQESVTREIEALRQQGGKNRDRAIQAVIDEIG